MCLNVQGFCKSQTKVRACDCCVLNASLGDRQRTKRKRKRWAYSIQINPLLCKTFVAGSSESSSSCVWNHIIWLNTKRKQCWFTKPTENKRENQERRQIRRLGVASPRNRNPIIEMVDLQWWQNHRLTWFLRYFLKGCNAAWMNILFSWSNIPNVVCKILRFRDRKIAPRFFWSQAQNRQIFFCLPAQRYILVPTVSDAQAHKERERESEWVSKQKRQHCTHAMSMQTQNTSRNIRVSSSARRLFFCETFGN